MYPKLMEPGEVTELPMRGIQNGIVRKRFIARPYVFQNAAVRLFVLSSQPSKSAAFGRDLYRR
jgi:hypothetical protein